MNAAHALAAAGLVLSLFAGPVRAASDWQPVPGAPDLQVDLATMQARGASVELWVRGLALKTVARMDASVSTTAKWHRTMARLQMDCRTRVGQGLGVLGYDSRGRLVHASSVTSARFALPAEGDLAALYDAACELARSQA